MWVLMKNRKSQGWRNRSGWSSFGWTTFPWRFKYFGANQTTDPWLRIILDETILK